MCGTQRCPLAYDVPCDVLTYYEAHGEWETYESDLDRIFKSEAFKPKSKYINEAMIP